MIGARYKCENCLNSESGKNTVTFMSWDSRIIASLPKSLAAEFPIVLTHHSGLFSPILALQRSLFQKGLGGKQFSQIIKGLHLHYFDQLHIQYLDMIYDHRDAKPWKNPTFKPFSEFADPKGYAGYVPSSNWLCDLYDQFIESHLPRINQYSAMLTARICAIDHSHKITKHIVMIEGVSVFVGLLTVTNEYGEIQLLALVATKAHAQFEIALLNMKKSLELYGHQLPLFFFTNNMNDKAFLEKCFPSLLLDVTPVDKYEKLPFLSLPSTMKVQVKSTAIQMQTALACIYEKLAEIPESESLTIGFDMEWNVNQVPGQSGQGPTAVVSIAFEDCIYILQISAFTHEGKLPKVLQNILVDQRIIKAGRGIQADFKKLQKEKITQEFVGGVDLAHLAKKCCMAPNAKIGLAELSAIVLGHQLNKDQNIRVSTHWEDKNLSDEQINYAALDAYASQAIYNKLIRVEKFGNIPDNAEAGLAVTIYQEDGQKIIAYGIWSELNFDDHPVVDGIDFQKSENIKLVAIKVQKISIPGAIITSHHKRALKDFGALPFTIICKRNQVYSSFPNEITINDQVPESIPKQTSIDETSIVLEQLLEKSPEHESWVDDVDNEPSTAEPVSNPNNYEIDQENLRIGAEFLAQIPSFKPAIRSRVLKDIWHIFDMISIAKNHGLRLEFSKTLHDAVFLINEHD